jgi:hypothetical protein
MCEIKDEDNILYGKIEIPVTKLGLIERPDKPMRNDARKIYCNISTSTNFEETQVRGERERERERERCAGGVRFDDLGDTNCKK